MKPLDQIGFRDWRAWVTARACGRVLEVGAGSGLNFPCYDECAQVVAFDPDPNIQEQVENSRHSDARIHLLSASAEELPFPEASFDAAVGTLVFCTIPNPRRALEELERVLKPGATLRLVEHVRAHNPISGRLMDAVTPLWKRMAGGCHLNRNTLETVQSSGFEVVDVKTKWLGLVIGIDARK